MKYIDADRLRKELNKWRDIQPTTVGLPRKATYEAMGVIQTIDHVLWLIDSLQQEQPEVDLEEIINNYFKDWKFDDELDIMVKPNNYSVSFSDLRDIAKHFYELGLNARKEDK